MGQTTNLKWLAGFFPSTVSPFLETIIVNFRDVSFNTKIGGIEFFRSRHPKSFALRGSPKMGASESHIVRKPKWDIKIMDWRCQVLRTTKSLVKYKSTDELVKYYIVCTLPIFIFNKRHPKSKHSCHIFQVITNLPLEIFLTSKWATKKTLLLSIILDG